jgi:CubicO group peptidase (beta-lactamase class C family)
MPRLIPLLILLVLAPATAWPAQAAQPQPLPYKDIRDLPGTPAVKRGQELLAALQANDPQRLRAFVETSLAASFLEQIPAEQHLEVLSQVAETAGHLKLYGVRTYDPPRPEHHAVLVLQNTLSEAWEAIVVEVEPTEPHRITSLQFSPARPPSDLPPPEPLTEAQAIEKFSQYMNRMAEEGLFSGTALIARGDEVLYEEAFGEADMGHHVANTLDTKFNLGSMNKMFTAVAVGQLAEQGKLSFDDPISKYLDESWLPKEMADKVQVKHLLTHTSGLGSYFNDTYFKSSRLNFRELADYKPLLEGEQLAFEPGTQSAYSNTGFLLLGPIIEKASGENYFDYVRRHVCEPAGMTGTDCYPLDEVVENLATGYYREGGKWKDNTFLHVMRGGPAGGGYSTVRDLHRFAQALRSDKLLSSDTRDLLWTAKPELSSPDYGYGFGVQERGGERVVGHSGGFPGINSDLLIYTDSGYTIGVMSNRSGGAGAPVSHAQALLESIAQD